MSSKVARDYRLTEEEASKLDAKDIICTVCGRIWRVTPSFSDSDAMEEFFNTIPPIQAAVFSALAGVNFAVVGGMWHIFEVCSAPMIYSAIEGFELFHTYGPADTLRRACACFPNGVVPRSKEEVEAFIFGDKHRETRPSATELGAEFESGRAREEIEAVLDFESVYRDHPECFVIPNPSRA